MLLGLLDVWYRNFHGFTSRSVAPYHQGLKRLPAYLQQLEMESNGKRVDRDGEPLPFGTSPVVWGEPGTNGQHAYFQMLHQGTDVVPVEFIAVRRRRTAHADLHAQAARQLPGAEPGADARQDRRRGAGREGADRVDALDARRWRATAPFPATGRAPPFCSTQLTPRALGALIALYEHRVFTSGALWGINSFDQWGVELGKALCSDLLPRLASGDVGGLDGSTAGLLQRLTAA